MPYASDKQRPWLNGNRNWANPRPCLHCGTTYTPTGVRQKWCTECVTDQRSRGLVQRYGINQFMWDAMYFDQDGSCLLCPDEATEVDHSHQSGKVRGLLCRNCNTSLGHLENLEWKRKAEDYLAVCE